MLESWRIIKEYTNIREYNYTFYIVLLLESFGR